MVRVSIIIPVYNYGRFLAESLESVLCQDYQNFEVIVVDDGSTDETPEVSARYADRVRYVRQEHSGIAVARNYGISLAKGEMIAFHDADDVWVKGSLRRRVAMLEQHPELGLIFGDVTVEQYGKVLFPSFLSERTILKRIESVRELDNRVVFSRSVYPDLLKERFIPIPTILIPRQRFDEVGLWDPSAEGVEDYEFYIRMAKRFRLGYIDSVLAVCRIHGSNVCCNVPVQNSRRLALLHKYKNDPDLSPTDRKALVNRISDLHLESAWCLRRVGDMSAARKHYRLAWTYNRWNYKAFVRYAFVTFAHSLRTEPEKSHPEVV